MSAESYVLYVPAEHRSKTDSALEAWLNDNPLATVDEAISELFQIGVNIQTSLNNWEKERGHV